MADRSITKAGLVSEIARLIGVPVPAMSTGSTEPREIFDQVDQVLGLRIVEECRAKCEGVPTKPDMARLIVTSAGMVWLPTSESRGGTVTQGGLLQVLRAVRFFMSGFEEEVAP